MKDLTRRRFLTRSTAGVALAGAIAVVPGITAVMKLPGTSPKVAAGTANGAGPLVAHVRDLASGEIAFLVGSQRLIVRDPDLAVRLHAAALKSR
jgi:hypothetical protein